MRAAVVTRAWQGVLVLLLVVSTTFALVHFAPGDPLGASLEHPNVSASVRATVRAQLGLDRSLPVQFGAWITHAFRGDLGWSTSQARPVADALRDALAPTIVLGTAGLALGLAIGLLGGTWQAAHAGTQRDRWGSRATVLLAALPDFWLAVLLLLVIANGAHLAPTGGMMDVATGDSLPLGAQLVDRAWHLWLPTVALAIGIAARVARYQRAAVAGMLDASFIVAARGRGLSPRAVLWGHAARTAAGTTITLVGLLVPGVAAGTVFIERIFSWPGLGRLTLEAVGARDVPLAVGGVLWLSTIVVVASALADMTQVWLDPRVRRVT